MARSSAPDRLARLVVWSTWLLGLVGVLVFVLRYGVNVPFWDDWRYVPVLAGDRGLSFDWLWEESNSHRFPIAKLGLWLGAQVSGGDLRASMLMSALLLALIAALLIRQAAAVRGRTQLSDAFFPLLLLHWGHYDILLWSINFWFACSCAVMCLLIARLARGVGDDAPELGLGGLALLALMLPIQGGTGLAAAPAVALGLLLSSRWAQDPRRRRALRWLGVAMLALVAVYFLGLDDHGPRPTPPALAEQLRTSLQVSTTSMGPAGRTTWPFSALALGAGLGLSLLMLLVVWRRDAERRSRAVCLGSAIAGMLGVALVIGYSRGGFGWTAGFAARYVTPNSPLLVGLYFACLAAGTPKFQRWGPALLALAMLGLAPLNMQLGRAWAEDHAQTLRAFERDFQAGMPIEEVLELHGPSISPRQNHLLDAMQHMQRTGRGVVRD